MRLQYRWTCRHAHGPHRPAYWNAVHQHEPVVRRRGRRKRSRRLIYSRLVFRSATGDLVPDVAITVPSLKNGGISADGMEITYHLRHDAVWADGAPLTSRDVLFTHHAFLNPKDNVVDRTTDDLISKMWAPDAYTIKVRLARPYSPFVRKYTEPLLPAHILERFPTLGHVEFNSKPVGSGPYALREWVRDDHITFVRNDKYWNGRAAIKEIVERLVDPSAAVPPLRAGEADGALYIPANIANAFINDPRYRITRTLATFPLIAFNTTTAMVSDKRVRMAVAMAVDRRRMMQAASQGTDEVDNVGLAPFGSAYDP